MNKEQIDRSLEILIDLDNGEYDEDEQQAIMVLTELSQMLGIDKNHTVKSIQDMEARWEEILSITMSKIEQGDYEYFKTKIIDEEQEIYDYLLHYSYDFDIKKSYVKQHYNTVNTIHAYDIKDLADIMDLMKSEKNDFNPNKIISEQQDFIKWCVENAQEIGLNRLGITDVIKDQQQFIELSIQNEKELGLNISDIVSEQQKLADWCIKNNQQIGLNKFDLNDLMDEQFNSFIWCIENAKNIVLNGGDLGYLIQNYKDLCTEARKNDVWTCVNENSLEEITKWYNENKDKGKDDVSHFINEFCKRCIDELELNSNNILNIVKNNINEPEYIKRTNRKPRATTLNT